MAIGNIGQFARMSNEESGYVFLNILVMAKKIFVPE